MARYVNPEPQYSMVRRAGDMVFLSGFGPYREGKVVGGDVAAQTACIMELMTAALASEGATWPDVVRVNVFLRDLDDRDVFNDTYFSFFEANTLMPTRRVVGAGDLFDGILVELDAIAYTGEAQP